MSKKLLSFSLAVLSAFIVGNAKATLTSSDYQLNSGDNWITSDSQSGLQWLDLTVTMNQSFDQVRQGDWYANGFRYATKVELQTLFINAGTPDDNFDLSITHYSETKALIDLLGATLISTDRLSSYGLIGTDFFDNNITLQNHPVGETFSAQLGKLDLFPYIGEAHFTGGQPLSNEASTYWGSFLVRVTPVPEPNATAMFLFGLIIIFIYKRRSY
jgi:hypothetical protein